VIHEKNLKQKSRDTVPLKFQQYISPPSLADFSVTLSIARPLFPYFFISLFSGVYSKHAASSAQLSAIQQIKYCICARVYLSMKFRRIGESN
jgi:hypothetical protein